MKKVVLTGSSGLIGKEAIMPLKNAGFEVFCLNSKDCNLFDYEAVDKFFKKIKPRYLLHFAWITGGDYLSSPINTKLVGASMNMLDVFKKYGGSRAVFAGTCFEYDFKDEPIKETDALNPTTLYAKSKNELRIKAESFCTKNDISFGWGRIFYVFGNNEKEGRLTSSVLDSLKNNKKFTINCGGLVRDYMYSKDIANAFVKFLDTNYDGCVNIASGKGISLGEFASIFAATANKIDLLEIKNEIAGQTPYIVADTDRLKSEIGFNASCTFNEAAKGIIQKIYET